MNIRPRALAWLSKNHNSVDGPIYASKYYQPDESWPKLAVWWLEIPMKKLNSAYANINLLCESAGDKDFYYLRIPNDFLKQNLQLFHIRNNKISMYLSAAPDQLFKEIRGKGIDFKTFLISKRPSAKSH